MKKQNEYIIITTEEDLFKNNLYRSQIVECKINGFNLYMRKFRKLLIFVYTILKHESKIDKLPDAIIQHSLLDISRDKLITRGYNYYNYLEISIRCSSIKTTLQEILNILKKKKDNIELKLQLQSGKIIHFIMLSRFDYISIS